MQDTEVFEYIKQAFDLKSQKCYKQAVEMLYKALELESENIEILFQIGELYFLLNNFPRSIQYLEKVLQKNDRHTESLRILEKIYAQTNEAQKAYLTAEKLYSISKKEDDLIELIKICSQMKNLIKIEELEKPQETNDKVLFAIAKAYYDNGKSETAKSKLQETLKLNPENENALVLLGKIYFDESEFEKSKNIFNTFPKTTQNPEILNYMGLFALEDMNFIDAIKFFSKASHINNENPIYHYNLGNAYFYNGWIDEASKSYLQAIRLSPEKEGFRYSLAYLYFEQQNFEKAQREIDYILKNNPEYRPAHILNALLKLEKKDFLGAKSELENIMQQGENDNFTLISLAKVYKELGLYQKAEDLINQAVSNTPESLNYKCRLADIYIAENNTEKALKIIKDIININERFIAAYSLGAKAALKIQNFELAKDFAQKMINLDMNFAEGYYYLALVRYEEKDYNEAVECMKRAIMYDVNNAAYYAEMSKIYKAEGDYKTALEYIKEAENISGNTEYKIMYSELASLKRKAK